MPPLSEQLIIIALVGVVWIILGGRRARALVSPKLNRSWEERQRSPAQFSEPQLRRLAYLAELAYIAFRELWGIGLLVSPLLKASSESLANATIFLIDALFVWGAIAGMSHLALKYLLKRRAEKAWASLAAPYEENGQSV